ncbi:hypothetical protein PY092_03690 [Muricauda sp. 334s03]|uniref:Uncharacterized protein n=1 Tax=Flagellimonas yonaguniensis TaxID=3031325 RepID=A0ABT5XVZ4_9FLAO|nr:hypothetical protein [[Muricauda] yonaguniensis]MDF0715243.1 hypothetical protein [[Muricauda] yonaguniensis]
MPSLPISSTFTNFLHQSSPAPLQVTFATLEIRNHQNGQFLNHLQRRQSRIILQKTACKDVAELTVLDNLVFRFSFQFRLPGVEQCHNMEMLSLLRPLDHGRLYVDEEKLQLSFRIDAPDPSLRVEVTHQYQDICHLERLRPVAANPQGW